MSLQGTIVPGRLHSELCPWGVKTWLRIWKRAGWYLVFLELIINCILMNTLAVILENSFRESKDQFEAASELHHMTRKHFRLGFFNFKLMLARWRTPPITVRETLEGKSSGKNPMSERSSPIEKKIYKNWEKLRRGDSKIYLETTMTIYFNLCTAKNV